MAAVYEGLGRVGRHYNEAEYNSEIQGIPGLPAGMYAPTIADSLKAVVDDPIHDAFTLVRGGTAGGVFMVFRNAVKTVDMTKSAFKRTVVGISALVFAELFVEPNLRDPANFERASGDLTNLARNLRAENDLIGKLISEFENSWRGAAASAFHDSVTANLLPHLEDLATAVGGIGEMYEDMCGDLVAFLLRVIVASAPMAVAVLFAPPMVALMAALAWMGAMSVFFESYGNRFDAHATRITSAVGQVHDVTGRLSAYAQEIKGTGGLSPRFTMVGTWTSEKWQANWGYIP